MHRKIDFSYIDLKDEIANSISRNDTEHVLAIYSRILESHSQHMKRLLDRYRSVLTDSKILESIESESYFTGIQAKNIQALSKEELTSSKLEDDILSSFQLAIGSADNTLKITLDQAYWVGDAGKSVHSTSPPPPLKPTKLQEYMNNVVEYLGLNSSDTKQNAEAVNGPVIGTWSPPRTHCRFHCTLALVCVP